MYLVSQVQCPWGCSVLCPAGGPKLANHATACRLSTLRLSGYVFISRQNSTQVPGRVTSSASVQDARHLPFRMSGHAMNKYRIYQRQRLLMSQLQTFKDKRTCRRAFSLLSAWVSTTSTPPVLTSSPRGATRIGLEAYIIRVRPRQTTEKACVVAYVLVSKNTL